jgi:hypothetical protein
MNNIFFWVVPQCSSETGVSEEHIAFIFSAEKVNYGRNQQNQRAR